VTAFDVDAVALAARELLRERRRELVAEACAWAVGLSDQPHHARRHGRVVPTGVTLGTRTLNGQPLASDEDTRLDLDDARPGTFQDVLGALTPDGGVYADRFEEQVLVPFVLETCVRAVDTARRRHPEAVAELLDELGEDGSDLVEVVRAAEWEAPMRTEAELLVLAALGHVSLVEVEAEGLPLSLVRAAERLARDAVPAPEPVTPVDDLDGALFLAEAALREADLPLPVPPPHAEQLLDLLLDEGLDTGEVLALLPHLPVQQDTAEHVAVEIEAREV